MHVVMLTYVRDLPYQAEISELEGLMVEENGTWSFILRHNRWPTYHTPYIMTQVACPYPKARTHISQYYRQ